MFPHRALASLRGRTETVCQKLTWQADERFSWKCDHQILILHELSALGSDGGEIIMSVNVELLLQKTVHKFRRGGWEEDFRGFVLVKSVTVSRRAEALSASNRRDGPTCWVDIPSMEMSSTLKWLSFTHMFIKAQFSFLSLHLFHFFLLLLFSQSYQGDNEHQTCINAARS